MMSFDQSFGQSMGQTVQVIGFGRRFVAYLIDVIILSIVGGLVGFVIGLIGVVLSRGNEDVMTGINLIAQCLSFLIGVAYYVGFWATTGQTLGKMVMGIKVISTDGSPVSWGKALLRYLGYIISGLVLAIGFIWIAFDNKRQGWHDKIASTYVVRKDTNFSATDAVTFVPSDSGSGAAMVIILLLGLFIIVPICVIAILLLLGPTVGNVFSNIIQNLETPVP
jgi:uncharacterized RDD family membrane protein YckC